MWPRSGLYADADHRPRVVIRQITKRRLHLLMPPSLSCWVIVFIYVRVPNHDTCLACPKEFGEKKKRDAPLLKEGPMSESPRPGAFLCGAYVLSLCWRLGSPASSHCPNICICVGLIALRCEYLCESLLLLLYVSPAMSWRCSLPGGVQHYIIKQVFAHYKHVCLFRKLLWTILKRKLQ